MVCVTKVQATPDQISLGSFLPDFLNIMLVVKMTKVEVTGNRWRITGGTSPPILMAPTLTPLKGRYLG